MLIVGVVNDDDESEVQVILTLFPETTAFTVPTEVPPSQVDSVVDSERCFCLDVL